MCGRIVQKTPSRLIAANFGFDSDIADNQPRYNIPPSSSILAVRADPLMRLVYLKWGLIPSWSKDSKIGFKLSNARAETISEKPSFRSAYRLRRCLIPIDGFYEWKAEGDKKQPYYIQQPGGDVFFLAGLWEKWTSPENQLVESCTIITTAAKGEMSEIHNRMPIVVPEKSHRLWLSDNTEDERHSVIQEAPSDFIFIKVNPRVNSTKVDDAGCIIEV